jgi:molybdate transport system ATP-binding protein
MSAIRSDHPAADSPRLVSLDSATISRPGGGSVLRDLTWAVREGETWAVVGPIGSGKTTLAEALLGRHHIDAGSIGWPFIDPLRAGGRPVAQPSDVIRLVSFKEESRLFSYSRHYYQQRFNFIEPQDDLTLGEFLCAGTPAPDGEIQAAANQLGVGGLLDLSFIKLSNGQTRRARIARALLARPELLILDDPFLGLDAAGREKVAALLGGLVRRGTRVLLIARPDAIPEWVTHVLELDGGTARWQGPRSEFRGGFEGEAAPTATVSPPGESSGEPVVELSDVTVTYDGRPILDRVFWSVRAGERWAVLGPNGSGKTTLLSLLCGDHPQAYGNDVRLFGRRRGTGESIWEIKRRVGLVSPELHLYFREPLTAARTAETGFADVLAYRPVTPGQAATVRELFGEFAIAGLAERPFARLSTGEQRLVLLVRALVKWPELLILDEPFQGLDRRTVRLARDWLDRRLRPDQTLLFVSHTPPEIPQTVSRRLRLDRGRVVERV